jgi:alginate O-acetyltransferase complex protein AlgI
MGLAGMWHGAGWQFLIFGLLHGCFLTVNHAWRVFRPVDSAAPTSRWERWATIAGSALLTYCAVLVAQVFFRAGSVGDALQILSGMSGLNGVAFDTAILSSLPIAKWIGWIVLGFAIAWALPNSNEIVAKYERILWPAPLQGLCYALLLVIAAMGASGPPVQFLYFQF